MGIVRKTADRGRKLCWCAVLCSLLLCACAQGQRTPAESAAAQPMSDTGDAQDTKEIEAQESAAAQETRSTPDLFGAENADEVLALLIEDEGFRECVRYSDMEIEDDSAPESILRMMEECESLVLREAPYGRAIRSLESLSLFPNLKRLTIDISEWNDSAIEDFTPIAQLSGLEQLYVSYGKEQTIDLSFIGGMRGITELYLTQCDIADLSFLEQMPQLQRLSLYGTPVADLAVLENLTELVELSLAGNENAEHMEVVGTLTRLQDLGIQYCGIEDIRFLSRLTDLRGLNLNGNAVRDITPLAGLVKLERLGLSENGISDISAVGGLVELFDLAADKNEIRDISALAGLPRLNQAGLSDNHIEDFSPLAGKKELMYAAVSGNPAKSIASVWEVPMLLFTETGVSEEEEAWIADWLKENYPEAGEFECIDFVRGDLNDDGLEDIAFVADSDAFAVNTDDFPRRLFVLLQRKDGAWQAVEEPPSLPGSTAGGMRGDPYFGAFMEPGYLVIRTGWGSSSGSVVTTVYEYRDGSLAPVKTICASDYNYAEGYDVRAEDVQTGVWRRYAIAMDGYRMVRVDLEDAAHPAHEAFPDIDLFDMSYRVYSDKLPTQITAPEALDRVCAALATDQAERRELPYEDWQKAGYELLVGVALPDYYYVLSDTDYIYYDKIKRERDGTLYHILYMNEEDERKEILLNDITGEILDTE